MSRTEELIRMIDAMHVDINGRLMPAQHESVLAFKFFQRHAQEIKAELTRGPSIPGSSAGFSPADLKARWSHRP